MGYQSTIIVLHDQLDGIEKYPKEFVENLGQAIRGFYIPSRDRTIRGGGGCCNPAQIVAQDHADTFRMLVVGSNTAWDLGTCGSWNTHFRDEMSETERKEWWLKRAADELGFRLVKKPAKKVKDLQGEWGVK